MEIAQLWQLFHQPLKKFVISRTGDPIAADDIVQDTFIKIHLNIKNLRNDEKIKAWVYQITRNAIIDYYRRERSFEELPFDLPVAEEDIEISTQLASCIEPMIEQLPFKYREALTITELEGYTQVQLSMKLGISLSGAKSRVQRGRLKLKELLLACCHVKTDLLGHIQDYEINDRLHAESCTPSCNCNL
ncbi:RNA polymerase sigma factor SigZ [Paenibacillus harenae]|uniref:RNA polymerase sigma factor SigZ n=1 Tax=Paenibacillus harenae TaxID=306543 RepID=A0ABT9U945_PAEHA|nr:RNA polymerase sigma factor SigZ [Paenibacillus harenae]MDQ0116164.1 RNA polymerase sigma-70 factor (ECF subfamily) [Paenibacillus harenae]